MWYRADPGAGRVCDRTVDGISGKNRSIWYLFERYRTARRGQTMPNGRRIHRAPLNTPVKAVSRSTGKFTIENNSGVRRLICGTTSYKQTIENIETILEGKSKVVGITKGQLTFGECVQQFSLGCTEINPKTNHEITGEMRGEIIKKGIENLFTLESGFNMKCVIGGYETELGSFDGRFWGTPVYGGALIFEKNPGIEGMPFAGENDNITGTFTTETEVGKARVAVG